MASDFRGWWQAAWIAFWGLPRGFLFGAIIFLGGIISITAWTGFNAIMDHTNTLQFCVSCHEMEASVYQEYKASAHYSNPSGVRVICADCHVPRAGMAKLIRKVQASADVYHSLVGTISTPEKFSARRRILAERVWADMIQSDSRECRQCHSYEAMAFHKQSSDARQKMQLEAAPKNKTCIECHRGIAHKFPVEPRDD
jgi:nitrate/TMAO reductase-like tetraheme cytochrome c subunit